MAKKLTLADTHEDNYLAFGIVSQEEGYQLCLSLNKTLNIKLALSDSIILNDVSFAHFKYFDDNGATIHCIENRSKQATISSSIKNIDYLLIIKSPLPDSAHQPMVKQLKSCPFVQAVVPVPADVLKKSKLLLFL